MHLVCCSLCARGTVPCTHVPDSDSIDSIKYFLLSILSARPKRSPSSSHPVPLLSAIFLGQFHLPLTGERGTYFDQTGRRNWSLSCRIRYFLALTSSLLQSRSRANRALLPALVQSGRNRLPLLQDSIDSLLAQFSTQVLRIEFSY